MHSTAAIQWVPADHQDIRRLQATPVAIPEDI